MVRIGEDRTERLEIVPAQPKVIVTIRPKYACPNKQGGLVQALAPVHLIEGGLPTEGTLAHVGVSKYADHCPLFRQSQILSRSGLNIDRSTLANWMGKVSFHLAPVVDHMFKDLKTSTKLFAGHDEGGWTWARIASIIETCKLNNVEPYAYLKATLEAIAAGHPAARIDELMPWNFDKQA